MTVEKLAEKLGIHHSQISRFENGYRTMRLETILRLCDALGQPKGYVFGGEGELREVKFVETDRRKRRRDEADSG
jgi:transcriptional regulator with XRE-family HTH domain